MKVKILQLRLDSQGERHPDTIAASITLADTIYALGRVQEAEKILNGILSICQDVLGEQDPETIRVVSCLIVIYHNLGKKKETGYMQVKLLQLRRKALGERHLTTLLTSTDLALFYAEQGRLEEAMELTSHALNIAKMVLSEDHPSFSRIIHIHRQVQEDYDKQGSLPIGAIQESIERPTLREDSDFNRPPNPISSPSSSTAKVGSSVELNVIPEAA